MALPTHSEIVGRMMEALQELKRRKIISPRPFCEMYEINRRNFWLLEKNPDSKIFNVEWLSILVIEFGLSAHWLLTGEGDMFEDH